MATVNKIDIAGLEGNEAAQPRVFAHSAIAVALPAASGGDTFVYVVPNTGVAPTAGDTQTLQTRGACIYIGSVASGSDLDVELESGSRVTFKGLTAGSFLPILVTKIYVTNSSEDPTTTVSDVLALF
tara:strand:- start:133 stop:513 length:381 start_codon:yes stop_codon:yes gene_type:complete